MSERRITSKQLLQKLQLDYYLDLNKARYNGRKVAWASSIVPQEFMEVMNIAVAYPENHSAAIAAKKGALPYIDQAEKMGYSNDICSYARINLAYAAMKTNEIPPLPKPNFVVCTNNICNVLIKWYESLAKHFKVPFFLIDVPFNHENCGVNEETSTFNPIPQDRIDYVKAQFEEFIKFLEDICGKKFDYEKFKEVMTISNRTAKAWSKAMNYASMMPTPLDGFNMFNYMAMMVCLRGKKESAMLYEMIAAEMEENIKAGKSQFPGEQKYRIMWDGIACWPYLKHNYTSMLKNGVVISGSTYPKAWEIVYEVGNMDELASIYAGIGNNRNLADQRDIRAVIQRSCKCDGVIYHMNRSCKVMDFMQPEMRRQISEITNIPFVSFDGDQSDPKNFSEAQFETRVEALVENMKGNKEGLAQ
ncbi:2-hydroxyacyl-CoA dehydratase subunit D [Geosporobacter ferrireducens]|uniref:2-hydroxyglutaryl-CoA dehydratase n=1 Tax=Geosporobacter ferrireducens TaxID=1424294 RepID=A0A1D8GK74_9FIRM|nr:2-hydroxyacyl-CoA dehydratase family protein [Geosporobacter ferrireducens]AOT71310.1 2-hydroxyglutaryl-CoA dehydratase [Geosporobacter ferrireducens]